MKVRVCPACRKHNPENAWYCADCGATLPIKTLVDVEDGQPSVVPFAGQPALSRISPHFEQDVVEILDTVVQSGESIVWGCNVTQLTGREPFLFGYLIITSQRLICVQFNSDIRGWMPLSADVVYIAARVATGSAVRPSRACLEVWTGPVAATPRLAVDCPSYPLTAQEKASRSVQTYDLGDLVSGHLEAIGHTGVFVNRLTARFRRGKAMTVDFLAPDEAMEAHKLLAAWLRK